MSLKINLTTKIFIVKWYYKSNESIGIVTDHLKQQFRIEIDNSLVLSIIMTFEASGSVSDSDFYYNEPKKRVPQHPEPLWSKEEEIAATPELDFLVSVSSGQEDKTIFDLPVDDQPEETIVEDDTTTASDFDYILVEKDEHQKEDEEEETPSGIDKKPPLTLDDHQNIPKQPVWVCDVCGKVSSLKRVHVMHLKVHSDDKPHKCNFCYAKFARLQGLKRHLHTHTGERPYVCSICGQRFTAYMTHQMHVRLHTGERPHKCKHCAEGFIGLPALNVR